VLLTKQLFTTRLSVTVLKGSRGFSKSREHAVSYTTINNCRVMREQLHK